MTSWIDRFCVALCLVHLGIFTSAIYNPKEITTKEPNRRESQLPWYLNEKDLHPPDDLVRSAKWWIDAEKSQTRKPVIVNSDKKSWTPWRKVSDSEIEQRTEITDDQLEQNHDQDQFGQFDDWRPFPVDQYEYGSTSKDNNVYQDHKNLGTSPKESKHKLPVDDDQTLLYEGIGSESTKPRKERILFLSQPISTVAHYDSQSGVQCPSLESTGQFVYPPDCKFFVNCWKGRAFVQPCSPGTLFNPETLECDFPDKVKCYDIEIFDLTHYSNTYSSKIHAERGQLQKPECPPHVTGLIAHPTNCAKFLQCAHGKTFEKDCDHGTVFNPAISVCDWPYNVRGCEDALKSKEDTIKNPKVSSDPSFHDYHHDRTNTFVDRSKYNMQSSARKIECPADFTGLVPHPETCKKFLQCANGVTYVMDCGPGTVFNPLTSVCDWPYNVRGCEDALKSKEDTTKNPKVSSDPSSHDSHHDRTNTFVDRSKYNTQSSARKIECPADFSGLLPHPETCKKFLQCANGVTYVMDCGPGTAFNPLISVCDWPYKVPACKREETSKQVTTTSRPWPQYGRGDPGSSYEHPRYNHTYNRYDHHGQGSWNIEVQPTITTESSGLPWRPTWIPMIQKPDYNRRNQHNSMESPNYHDSQIGTPPVHYYDHDHHYDHLTGSGQSTTREDCNTTNQMVQRQEPCNQSKHYHYHHHHHHYHHNFNNSQYEGANRRISGPNGYQQGSSTSRNTEETWNRKPLSHDYNHQINIDEFDKQQSSNTFGQINNRSRVNLTTVEDTLIRRNTPHGPIRNKFNSTVQTQSKIDPELLDREPNESTTLRRNIYVENTYKLPDDMKSRNRTNRTFDTRTGIYFPKPNQDNVTWNRSTSPENRPHVFVPNTWNNQLNQSRIPNQRPTRPWNQGRHVNKNVNICMALKRFAWHDESCSIYFDSMLDHMGYSQNKWVSIVNDRFPNNSYINAYWEIFYIKGYQRTNEEGLFSEDEESRKYKENDTIDEEEKLREWLARTNIQQQITNDKEADSKMDKWSTKTNVFLQAKGQVSTGDSNSTQISGKPFYPYGIYVNYNGTKGHFITKELEIDQGHSRTKTYNPNNQQTPFSFNRTYGSVYTRTPLHNQDVSKSPIVPSNHYPVRFTPNPVNIPQPSDGDSIKHTFNQSRTTDLRGAASHHSTGKDFHPVSNQAIDSTINRSITIPQLDSRRAVNRSIEQFDAYPLISENAITEKMPDVYSKPFKKKSVPLPQNIPENQSQTTDPNVLVEYDMDESQFNDTTTFENENSTPTSKEVVYEADVDPYDVDIIENKETWKPVLVFENKTKTARKNESSFIMRINKKNTEVDIFNIEVPPYHDEEPPFPVYYIPPVQPLSHMKKTEPTTPISGQIIRLRGGSGPAHGYVEVQGAQPGWGIVCDSRNSWMLKEAHVVCRQLGYIRGAEMAWQGRNKRSGMPTWIAANSVTCSGTEKTFQSCKFTHGQECRVERDAIGVRCLPNRIAHCRKDEIPHEGQCYHLADSDTGLNHAEALQYCNERDSRLIDITSQEENNFVSEWLLQLHPIIGSIMTSGVGFTTLNRTLWLWEDSSRAKFKFTKWWPGWMEDKQLPPWVGSRPACIIMKRKFPCHNHPDSICVADYFFWDIEDCATSVKGHSYICKRPYDDIGCVYGKGNQYFGTANVSSSGKECLPWADNRVLHYLNVKVVNREVKEKLRSHNYCRNPDSNRESRPWCFTGFYGELDYCDIPPCGKMDSKKLLSSGQCKPKHFECLPGECIPTPWVCDGEEDCTNGADERACMDHLNLYQKSAKHRLEGYDVEKWLNTPLKTCALRCKEADFTCRSFAHKASENICLLSDSNIGLTGALKPTKEFDYYEMKERSINCDDMFICGNRKCINQTLVCNGKNDCNDRTDENICTVENLGYAIRLAGSDNSDEGRIEVKIWDKWGQVCDDGFDMINAGVICKELGFPLGALEVKPGGFYGNLDPPNQFMVDQLKCRGNETSLRECDFEGWGIHNCQPEEAVGVVCKTAVDSCQEGYWNCEDGLKCIPMAYICDEVDDCYDKSDESDKHCNAPFEIRLVNGSSPLEGRVEIRHHGIWGTVCDDDFSAATARVICRSLGYAGIAKAKKDGYFGPGQGPIWLDEVSCRGNETQLKYCNHNHWGQNNCDHNEDAGVICSHGAVNNDSEFSSELLEPIINNILPTNCGKRSEDFNDDEDLIFAKVVHGSIAAKGTYPWQASIRVRRHSRSNHWCGAVILSPLHVLTAAHCLEGYNKGMYFVRAGDYHTEIDEGTEKEANIKDYYIHEDFRKGHRMNNDIALVLLQGQGIPLGKDIMPICLPSENTEYPAGLNCTISGFGSIESGKTTPSRDLRYGWIPLLDQSICRAEYVYGQGKITDGMVCAGYLEEGVDTCDGDSGGPLACYHNGAFTLYGITSWGQHCGRANKPGVYVRVAHYRSWIDQKIMDSLSGK